MNIFTKKGTVQKTIIAILMVLCINFIVPTYSHAGFIGGVLINPLLDLAASLGDIVESLLQWSMTGQMAAGLKLSDSKILVDQGDNRIVYGAGNSTISVSKNELELGWLTKTNVYQVPIIEYTPEEIFSNKIPYLDINFINPTWTKDNSHYGIDGTAQILQETIAGWYIALRNLAIVGLLCVLVYVGIRMMLCSTASDKAKYKTMFTDWLIALCILFFLHYIMSFTLVMVDAVNNALTGGNEYKSQSVVIDVDGEKYATNFMGAARFMTQSKDTYERFGYFLIYAALVVYTAIFTLHYLKRLLSMAFLTVIAPLVALTYPIDKIGDGKAQAFNMWLKEYVYNALIQPFHLIIYMIFLGSAMDLAKVNLIYAIVAIAFILPAEKLLKKMFGFDKGPLGTMGALAGFAAGSLFSNKKGASNSKGGNTGGSAQEENRPPRYERHHGTDGIDFAENHNVDRGGPQGPAGSGGGTQGPAGSGGGPQGPTMQEEEIVPPDPRGLPGDDAIDVDYTEVPLGSAPNGQTQNNSQQQNGPFQRLSDDDVEEFAPERPLGSSPNGQTQNNQEQQNGPFQRLSDDDVEEFAPERPRTMEDFNSNSERQASGGSTQEPRERVRNNGRQVGRIRQGMRNVANSHGGYRRMITGGIIKGAKTLGKASKFTAKTAFTAAGALAGAGAGLASGKGLAGVIAGATAGKNAGQRLGTTITNVPENLYGLGKAAKDKAGKVIASAQNTIDTFNGDTRLADKAQAKAFMKDKDTEQYVRDKLTADNNGRAPSGRQVKEEMNNIKRYADEGMTDISQIYRAKKAEKFGVEPEQAAKIALLAQDRKITSDVLGDEKKYKAKQEDFTQEFIDKGLDETQAAAKADYILNVMKAQVGQRHNLGGGNTGPRSQAQNNAPDRETTRRGPRTQNANPGAGPTSGGPRTQNGNNGRRRGRPRTQNNNQDPNDPNN